MISKKTHKLWDPQAYLKWIDVRFQEQELTSDVILLFLNKKLTSSQLIS